MQAPRNAYFFSALACIAAIAPAQTQVQTGTAPRTSMDRAQREADMVLTWIKSHGQIEHTQPARTPTSKPKASHRRSPARETEVVHMPHSADQALLEPVETPSPTIPDDMRGELRSGFVQVRFRVAPGGNVISAEAVKSTHQRLKRPAIDTVLGWRFKPIRHEQTGIADIDFRSTAEN